MIGFDLRSKKIQFTVSVSGIYNWIKNKNKKQDLDNIHSYEEEIKNRNTDESPLYDPIAQR